MENPHKVDIMALLGDKLEGRALRHDLVPLGCLGWPRVGREECSGAARHGPSKGVRLPCSDAIAVFSVRRCCRGMRFTAVPTTEFRLMTTTEKANHICTVVPRLVVAVFGRG